MKQLCSIIAAALLVTVFVTAQEKITPALAALADAERAFAKTATEKGIRDSFLEFFADDAVALVPEPASWKSRLRGRPSVPFSAHELLWEPRVGDVAASGEIGWLTGPSTFTDRKDKQAPQYGNYLSVWRKQADGSWKVFLDIGSDAPGPVAFEEGFHRYAFGPRYTGTEGKSAAAALLLERDRAMNARLAKEEPAVVYAAFLAPNARLHRNEAHPIVGRDAAARSMKGSTPSLNALTGAAESAQSGDLGYSYGTYTTKEAPQKGSYMRLWSRTKEGQWLIVTEVMSPPPPSK
jgi:ketosteroid isomerase-like protein